MAASQGLVARWPSQFDHFICPVVAFSQYGEKENTQRFAWKRWVKLLKSMAFVAPRFACRPGALSIRFSRLVTVSATPPEEDGAARLQEESSPDARRLNTARNWGRGPLEIGNYRFPDRSILRISIPPSQIVGVLPCGAVHANAIIAQAMELPSCKSSALTELGPHLETATSTHGGHVAGSRVQHTSLRLVLPLFNHLTRHLSLSQIPNYMAGR